jgi:gamma-butyrobetaine dioxygenase
MALPVHVDLATRERMPGLQFLHCLENSTDGGDSLLADGFWIAAQIAERAPGLYTALSTIPLVFANKASGSDFRFEAPMFSCQDGRLDEVRWSPWLRGPVVASFEETDQVYKGLRMAFRMAEQPAALVRVRLQPGEVLCMDNRRILHGRTGFDPSSGARWLRGCYVDREDLLSQIRIRARRARARQVGDTGRGA